MGWWKKEIINILKKVKPNGEVYFSKDGNYAGAGSKGLQSKLYKNIAYDLKYIKSM